MTDREQGEAPNRRWLAFLPLLIGLLVLGLMGWGLFEGISSLVRTLRPEQPGNASIALSAGFVPAESTAEAPAGAAPASASPQTAAPGAPASPAPAATAGGAGGSGQPAAAVPGGAEEKPAAKEKAKRKQEPPPVFEIRGSVQRNGKPIESGKVRLTVSLVGERFRQSTLADLNPNGEFRVYNHPAFRVLKPKNRIRVVAEVWPAARAGQGQEEPLTETVYLNHHLPSYIRSSTGYGVLLGVLLFAALFLWAFTGRSTYAKNRLAIVLSYCVIFLSLAGALVGPTLLMLAVPDLPDISGKVPVGLVVARLTENSKPEWMLNLGGYVESGESVTSGSPFQEGEAGGAASGGDDESLGSPVLRVVSLNGGIQIPLYVILLAMIGGAINMTRQVPAFQSRQPGRPGFLDRMGWGAAASAPAPAEEQQERDEDKEEIAWRKGLLEQYMFLIAAPFLAIATYYMLILLGTIQPPIIVLVCFSIGLISDTVVTAITEAAKKLLGGKPVKEEPAQPAAEPAQPAAGSTEAAETGAEEAAKPKKVA